MIAKLDIYKCGVCGNIVEVLTVGGGELVCCGKPMNLIKPNTVDAAKEKHVPVLEGGLVKVGSVAHPMEEKHYIEWIAVRTDNNKEGRKFLKPGDKPEAFFEVDPKEIVEVLEYCNLHGLWSNKIR